MLPPVDKMCQNLPPNQILLVMVGFLELLLFKQEMEMQKSLIF